MILERKEKKIFLIIPVLTVFVIISNFIQIQMNQIRDKEKLTDTSIVENAPPIIAFTTVALGSFRGILADILWLRVIRLQDQGQYFEMVQLASWITKLQPRFTAATAYLAWNMAYNISVTCSSFEDRWRWVKKGIELIRDEALFYNPGDPVLYKELGWIYQHKLGNIMDDASIYYKNQMTVEMMKVFGAETPDWNQLSTAEDLDKLAFQADIISAINAAGFNNIKDLEKDFRKSASFNQSFLDSFKNKDDLKKLELSLRKKWLKEVYKLDPAKIVEINQKYGELDWRLPEAHAIYWASLGITYDKNGQVEISCDRMIAQSLKEAFMAGKVLIYDENDFTQFMSVPNLNMADAVKKTYEEAYNRQKSQSFRSALENFMIDATVLLYNFGQYTKAEEYLNKLRDLSPTNPKFKKNIDQFVLKEWTEDVQMPTPKHAMDIISGLLFRTCLMLASGEINAAYSHERMAYAVYQRYYQERKSSWKRTGLPPFNEIKNSTTQKCIEIFPEKLSKALQIQLKSLEAQNKKNDYMNQDENK